MGVRLGAMTSHIVASPHDRLIKTVCEQVGCIRYHQGWEMLFDERTDQGAYAARYVRSGAHGRTYRELGRTVEGLTPFRFEAYQRCFEDHRTRPELFVVRAADAWGGDLGLIRPHTRAVDFAEDLEETLDRRLTSKQKG